jgi:hypothetical protein
MFIGFKRVAKAGGFRGRFRNQGLDLKGLDLFLCGIPGFDTANSLRRHKHRKRQLDELFVLVDGVQGAAHVVRDFGGALLLDPVGQFKDGGLKGSIGFR